jgi:hypothetical protein
MGKPALDGVVAEFLDDAAAALDAAQAILLELHRGERGFDCVAGAELLGALERANVLVKCSVRVRPRRGG